MGSFNTYLKWVERFCYGNLIMGLVGLIAGIVLLASNSDFEDFGQGYNLFKTSYTVILVIGIAFFNLGMIGVFAARKKKNCIMGCYNISVLVFLIVALSFLILQGIAKVKISNFKDDTLCNEEDLMKDLKVVYDSGKNLLCSLNCPCNADISNFESSTYSSFTVKSNGADKVSECQYYDQKISVKFSYDYDSYGSYLRGLANLLRVAETTFDCSGFCSTNSYYVFRDMNDGKPDQNEDCREELVDFLSSTIIKSLIITLVLFNYLMAVAYFSIRTIFSSERKNNGGYYNQEKQSSSQNPNANNDINIYQLQQQQQPNHNTSQNHQLNNHFNVSNNVNTKQNNSINQINAMFPQQIQDPSQQNMMFIPSNQQTTRVQELTAEKYPNLHQNGYQDNMNNLPSPYQEQQNAKQYAKY